MDRWDRRLFGDSRPWVCGRAAGEHFRRRPLTHVRELGFLIEETQRLKLGIVERVCARKAKLAPLRSPVPETGHEGSLMYDATLAETATIRGDGGDEIEAYLAGPMGRGPFARADQRARRRAEGAGQDLRVPLLRGRRPRLFRGEPHRLPPGSRR